MKALRIVIAVSFLVFFGGILAQAEDPGGVAAASTDKHDQVNSSSPHPCSNCHKFDESKFKSLVRVPDLKVLSSEIMGGLWQVSYETQGGRNVVYTSLVFDRVIYGNMVYKDRKNIAQDTSPAQPPKPPMNAISTVPVRDAAFVMGNKEAKARMFLFTDPDCPLCAKEHFELKGFLAEHNNYAVYVMLYPPDDHAKAEEKSKVVYCIGENLFLREAITEKLFSDLLAGKKTETLLPDSKCDMSGLERVKRFGADVLGIRETPVILLPNGNVIRGFVDKKQLEGILSTDAIVKSTAKITQKGGGL